MNDLWFKVSIENTSEFSLKEPDLSNSQLLPLLSQPIDSWVVFVAVIWPIKRLLCLLSVRQWFYFMLQILFLSLWNWGCFSVEAKILLKCDLPWNLQSHRLARVYNWAIIHWVWGRKKITCQVLLLCFCCVFLSSCGCK